MDRFRNLLSAVWMVVTGGLILLPSLCEARAIPPIEMKLELFRGENMFGVGRENVGLNLARDLLVANVG